jgi:hypothetical protein
MSKNKYDALSTTAVVALVVSTFSAQHFSGAGYIFGATAVISAIAALGLYITALPKPVIAQHGIAMHKDSPALNAAAEPEYLLKVKENVFPLTHRDRRPVMVGADLGIDIFKQRYADIFKNFEQQRTRYLHSHEKYYSEVLRRVHADFREAAQVKFHPDVKQDPAVVIASVVERLCANSSQPHYEFILAADGSFKIKPISIKNAEPAIETTRSTGLGLPN